MGRKINRFNHYKEVPYLLRDLRPNSQVKKLIRLGSKHDGGHLIPDDLEGVTLAYSPGVSDNSDFEIDLVSRGFQCYLADASVKGPPIYLNEFHFTRKHIGAVNNNQTIRLTTWVEQNHSNDDMLLQMDIEGKEYQVLLDTHDELLKKFGIVLVEFHELDKLEQLLGYDLISTTFQKLLRNFEVVCVHPNNCCKPRRIAGVMIPPVMEFTFLRKDRFIWSNNKLQLPHPLDSPNIHTRIKIKEINLPRIFYN